MTVTTLDISWVDGVNTFPAVQPPEASRLTLPYHDDLRYTKEEISVRGCAPRYMTDQGGAFELVEMDDGYAICQKITPQIMPTNWRFRGTPLPITCFGDDKWHSYSAEAEVKLSNLEEHNFAGIGIRYNSTVTCEFTSMCGYTGRLYGDGSWKLMDMESVAAEGIIQHIDPMEWNKLKLMVLGNAVFFFINGSFLTKYTPQYMINSGRVSLNSEYAWNMFRNIHVDPVSVQPLYVRRVDCFGDGILYNENWDIHAMESYHFYNRTSMEAKPSAEFSCTFEGTGIAIVGTAQNAEFTVLIDGHTMYENFFVPNCLPRQACLAIDQLPEGTHNMRVFITGGQFKLDVLEIPELYPRMTDTLSVPANIRSTVAAQIRQKQTLQAQRAEDTFMDADAMLWHLEHPFTKPPKKEEVPVTAKPEKMFDNAVSTSNEQKMDPAETNQLEESAEVSAEEETKFDDETNQSMWEIEAIFDPAPETENTAKSDDVEMELTADEFANFLKPEDSKKNADHSAESGQA